MTNHPHIPPDQTIIAEDQILNDRLRRSVERKYGICLSPPCLRERKNQLLRRPYRKKKSTIKKVSKTKQIVTTSFSLDSLSLSPCNSPKVSCSSPASGCSSPKRGCASPTKMPGFQNPTYSWSVKSPTKVKNISSSISFTTRSQKKSRSKTKNVVTIHFKGVNNDGQRCQTFRKLCFDSPTESNQSTSPRLTSSRSSITLSSDTCRLENETPRSSQPLFVTGPKQSSSPLHRSKSCYFVYSSSSSCVSSSCSCSSSCSSSSYSSSSCSSSSTSDLVSPTSRIRSPSPTSTISSRFRRRSKNKSPHSRFRSPRSTTTPTQHRRDKSSLSVPSSNHKEQTLQYRFRRNSEQILRNIRSWSRSRSCSPSNLVFYCPVCLSYKLMSERIEIQPCGHRLCFNCAHAYITKKLSERQIPVCCLCLAASSLSLSPSPPSPAITTSQTTRRTRPPPPPPRRLELQPLSDVQCRKVLNAKEMKFYELVSFGAILQPCFGVDCKGFLPGEKGQTQCIVCHKEWCASCKVPWHRKLKCSQFQKIVKKKSMIERKLMKQVVKKFGFKNCPTCNTLIEKISGCNHITCYPPCKTHFCWRCLTLLNPNKLEEHYGKLGAPCYGKMMAA